METTLNYQKYLNYKEQYCRLKKALNNCFYLEAIFIEYVILEDRSESILRYTNKFDALKQKGSDYVSIDRKLKKISKLAEEKKSIEHLYFKEELIDGLLRWKEERNGIMHALLKRSLTTETLSSLAYEGLKLVKEFSRVSNNYKRKLERLNLLKTL